MSVTLDWLSRQRKMKEQICRRPNLWMRETPSRFIRGGWFRGLALNLFPFFAPTPVNPSSSCLPPPKCGYQREDDWYINYSEGQSLLSYKVNVIHREHRVIKWRLMSGSIVSVWAADPDSAAALIREVQVQDVFLLNVFYFEKKKRQTQAQRVAE